MTNPESRRRSSSTRGRRVKSNSSLAGMLTPPEEQDSIVCGAPDPNQAPTEQPSKLDTAYSQSLKSAYSESLKSDQQHQEMLRVSRRLRRAKRRLFLKSVEMPCSPQNDSVDKLRDVLSQISIASMTDDDDEAMSQDSSMSLRSNDRTDPANTP